ncbi:MAG TPA: hypothetical protein GX001_03515 [Acholeplasmataceae bacterium]|nr:hypothetical protein [Acholeplasmataceae bacterium]
MPVAEIMLGLNISVLVAIVIGFLVGLLRGFRKGIVMLILTIMWYSLAIIFIPFISRALLSVDISFLNSYLPSDIGPITSIKASLPEILRNTFPEQKFLFEAGSDSLALVFGGVTFILNVVLLIVFMVIHGTVFRIINNLIWLIFKPKRKEDGEKPKKRRLLGGLVGGVKAVLVLLLFAVPMAGMFSLANSMIAFVPPEEREGMGLFAAEEEITITDVYRKSLLGKTFNIVKIKGDAFDEYLFDSFFKIEAKINNKNRKLRIRKDVQNVSNIYQRIIAANDDSYELDESILYKLSKADVEYIFAELTTMDIFQFLQIIGSEYFYEFAEEKQLNSYNGEKIFTLEELKAIDLNKDLKTIGEIVLLLHDYIAQENFDNLEENIFSFDEETIVAVLDKVVKIEWLKYSLPIAVNLFLENEDVKKIITENNLTIVKPTKEELLADISNLKDLYLALKIFDLTGFDNLDNILENDQITFSDEAAEALVSAIFGFNVINKNLVLISDFLYETIFENEEDDNIFKDIITKEKLRENFNKNEVSHLLIFAKTIFDSGVFAEEEIDFDAFLTIETIEKLATHISSSVLLSDAMESFINFVVAGNEDVEIEIPDDVSFYGEDAKEEIIAFFTGIREILAIFIDNDNFLELDEAELEDIVTKITNSKILAHNLKKVVEEMFLQKGEVFDFDLTMPEELSFEGQQGKTELLALLKVIKTIGQNDFFGEGVLDLNDQEIEEIADLLTDSKIIRHNLGAILASLLESNSAEFGVQLVIPNELDFNNKTESKAEIEALLNALNVIKEEDFLTGGTLGLSNEEVADLLTNSIIIRHNLRALLETLLADSSTEFDVPLIIPSELDFNDKTESKDEVEALLNALNAIKDNDFLAGGVDNLSDEAIDDFVDDVTASIIIASNLNEMIEKILTDSLPEDEKLNKSIEVLGEMDFNTEDGKNELRFLLKGLGAAKSLSDYAYENIDEDSEEDVKTTFKDINESAILRPLLIEILTGAEAVNDYRYQEGDSGYQNPNSFNKVDWDNEIDVVVGIIVILNKGFDVGDYPDDPNDVVEYLKMYDELEDLMARSKLYDESKLPTFP